MIQGVSSNSTSTQQTAGASSGNAPSGFMQKLKDAGIPSDVIAKGREAVMQYAQQNGISLPEPPAKQNDKQETSLFGDKTKSGQGKGGAHAEFTQELQALGVPASVISQGKEAVIQYAQQNNITLPQPPAPKNAGANLDYSA